MRHSLYLVTLLCSGIAWMDCRADENAVPSAEPVKQEETMKASVTGIPTEPGLYAAITTTQGVIVCALEFQKTPLTVANFVGLAEGTLANKAKPAGQPFYDGLAFHRVLANFMIQGGCPEGTGRGGPGYRFGDEIDETLTHSGAGILSMANAGPGTNGSQFFITHNKTPHLDGKHTVFGHVVSGQNVVNAIKQGDAIQSIRIYRVGTDAQAFVVDQARFDALAQALQKRLADKASQGAAGQVTLTHRFVPADAPATPKGVRYTVTQKGEGETPKSGAICAVHYTGKLVSGQTFDSSYTRGQPISFPVGKGQVIPGWDETVLLMKKGEKRTIAIPPALGYGARGAGGVIPPNAWLIFDVELVSFENQP
jgi:peptidylprolyl isomerase